MFRLRKRARSSRIGSRSITSMISRVQQDFYCLYKDSTTPHPDPPPAGEGEKLRGRGNRLHHPPPRPSPCGGGRKCWRGREKSCGEGEQVAPPPTPTLPLRGREKVLAREGEKLRGRGKRLHHPPPRPSPCGGGRKAGGAGENCGGGSGWEGKTQGPRKQRHTSLGGRG